MPARKKKTEDNPEVPKISGDLKDVPELSDAEKLDKDAAEGAVAKATATDADPSDINPEQTAPEAEEPDDRLPLSKATIEALEDKTLPDSKPTKAQKKAAADDAASKLNLNTPSTKRLGPLSEKVPGAEHIEIHKRSATGKLVFIESYDTRDLAQSQDTTAFIHRFIKPKAGGGEYQILGVDAKGQKFDAGVVIVQEDSPDTPPATVGGTSTLDIIKTLLSKDDRRPPPAPMAPPPDPIKALGEVHQLQERISASSKKETEGTFAAMIQAMSEQNRIMMTMMMEQSNKPKEMDPVLAAILTKLLEEKKPAPMPQMPPPPPPPDPTADLKNMAEVLAVLRPPQDNTTVELMKYLIQKSESERMGPRDVLAMVNDIKGAQPGTDDFNKSMENLTLMMQAVNSIKQQGEGGPTGIWDALTALASNRDFAGTVAGAIRAKTNAARFQPPGAGQQLPAQAGVIDFNQRVADLQRRKLAVEERKLQLEEANLRGTIGPGESEVGLADIEDESPEAILEQKEAVDRVVERTGGVPQLPPEIADHINTMLMAEDDAAVIESVLRMLMYLDELPDWHQVANTILTLIKNGEKENVMTFMQHFFKGLQAGQLSDQRLSDKVLKALEEHFELIVEKINNPDDEDEEDEETPEESENLDNGSESA